MKKILIFTQIVDTEDSVLGFFTRWIEEFGRQAEVVNVICLREGKHSFAPNVTVYSLGKKDDGETDRHPVSSRIKYVTRFFSLIFKLRREYDAVFVHMNQIYVILGGLFWRMWGKKIGLWYTHRSVTWSLKLALRLVHVVFTPAKEGFPLPTPKMVTTGQGINTSVFTPMPHASRGAVEIVTVGRVAPIKDYDTLLDAVEIVIKTAPNIRVTVLGGPGEKDHEYHARILREAEERGLSRYFNFVGAVPNTETARYLQESDLFVNMGHTGGMDKVVVEAMATGIPVLTCNEVFEPIVGPYGLTYEKKNAKQFAEKITALVQDAPRRQELGKTLREIAVRDHSLDRLVKKILGVMLAQ
jgi:glycosyltransferase involved in cell wall biosynthesis